METRPPVPALAALGASAGSAIARHMDVAFRAAVRGGMRTETPACLRLITGEPHPFGNFVIASGAAGADEMRSMVEPWSPEGSRPPSSSRPRR